MPAVAFRLLVLFICGTRNGYDMFSKQKLVTSSLKEIIILFVKHFLASKFSPVRPTLHIAGKYMYTHTVNDPVQRVCMSM